MKISYISHACLLIETDNLRIVTDPWVKEAIYCNQWHLFPKAEGADQIKSADYILYSHGHEDHLHINSLLEINKSATILFPYSWFGGTSDYLKSLGFNKVKEVINEKTVSLDEHTYVTYLADNLDTVLIIQHKNQVIVNINDALPSSPIETIDYFIKKIKERWPTIEYVFSSYAGASYFPNAVHYKNKNDVEIGEVRELFFLKNFCRIVSGLSPRRAIPFASDFVLLDDHQRWINQLKIPRNKIKSYYDSSPEMLTSVDIVEAYPGDYFIDGTFVAYSKYHSLPIDSNLDELLETEFKEELIHKRNKKLITASETARLLEKIKKHILFKEYIIPGGIKSKIRFALYITDGSGNNVLVVDFTNRDQLFSVNNGVLADVDVKIEVNSAIIEYSIDEEWGEDALMIGYGAEIFIHTETALHGDFENYIVRLLSRYPNTREYLKKDPFRGLKYLITDSLKRKNLINRLRGKENVLVPTSPLLAERELWLNKSKCDVCKACNL